MINNNNNNLRVSNIRVSNRTLIYNVCPKSGLVLVCSDAQNVQ